MKKLITVLFLFFFSFNCYAMHSGTIWEKKQGNLREKIGIKNNLETVNSEMREQTVETKCDKCAKIFSVLLFCGYIAVCNYYHINPFSTRLSSYRCFNY